MTILLEREKAGAFLNSNYWPINSRRQLLGRTDGGMPTSADYEISIDDHQSPANANLRAQKVIMHLDICK